MKYWLTHATSITTCTNKFAYYYGLQERWNLSFVENILSILYGTKTRLTPEAAIQRFSCHFIEIALHHECSPLNLLHISENLFLRTPLDSCFCERWLNLYTISLWFLLFCCERVWNKPLHMVSWNNDSRFCSEIFKCCIDR